MQSRLASPEKDRDAKYGSIATSLFVLTEEEKMKSGGYDAILTCWVKILSLKNEAKTYR